ncbi:sorcin-like isoform X2 [Lineus longissimus]
MQGHGQPPHAQMQMMQNQWQQEQHYQQYQHFSQQSQVYGSYGSQFQQNVFSINPSQALAFKSEQEFQIIFNQYVSPTLGGIQAEELHKLLNDQPKIKNFYRITWSMELCKIMIMMLDRNKDGIMQYGEFKELLQCLLHWHQLFKTCADQDGSGFVEANELLNIIMRKFGYNLSHKAVTTLLKRYSRAMDDGRCLIAFDDFVALSVRLRAYTEAFRARDRTNHNGQETGRTDYGYDDFIQCVMCL